MANTRTKDVGVTKTTLAADTYLYGDGNTDGSHKILGSDVANYVATEEGGSTLASLTAGKVPASQLPSGFDAGTYLGLWDANANSPTLSNGSGTQGDYYIVGTAGTTSIDGISSWAVGDEIRANASAWEKLTPGTTAVTQGGTGATTAEGARTNLEVDSKDEAAEGLTRNEPSLYLNGSNEYLSVPDNAAFSMTDGTDDLPAFWSFWVKVDDWTSQFLVSKYGGSAATREWAIDSSGSDNLVFFLTDTSGNSCTTTLSGMNAYEGQWVHILISYAGAGPNSSNAFSAAQDGVNIYVNGVNQTGASHNNNASYTGQSDTSQSVHIGRENASYGEFEIRELQIGNTALTAAQVEQIYRSGVPFELSQASASELVTDGDMEASGTASWPYATGVTLSKSTASPYAGTNALRLTLSGTGTGYAEQDIGISGGKTYNVRGWARGDGTRIPQVRFNGSSWQTLWTGTSSTSWQRFDVTVEANAGPNGRLTLYVSNTGSVSDWVEFDNVSVTEAGAILDLRSRSVNGTTIVDESGNGFNGSLNNMSVAANAVNLPAALSANHPNPSSGEKILSLGNAGTEKIGGTAEGHMVVSSVAAGVGSELTIASGVVTASAGYHEIDTEGNAASDDLDTITASSWMGAGTRLVVMAIDDSHTVVLKDGTGNLRLAGDFSMDTNVDTMELIYDGTNWCELSRSNNS